MNIALFALAVLMIVGGIASVIQGFPFVRLESGMAMTVAGATVASAGAVLLGLAVVARHLHGLGQRLGDLRLASPEASPARTREPTRAFEPPRAFEPEVPGPDMSGPVVPEPVVADPVTSEKSGRQRPSLDGLAPRDAGPGPGIGGLGPGFEAEFAAGLAGASIAASAANDAPLRAGPGGRGTEPTFVLSPEPAAPEPAAQKPHITEPHLAEPHVAEPPLAEPHMAEPTLAEPAITQPRLPDLLPPPAQTVTLARPFPEPVAPAPVPPAPEMETVPREDQPKPRVHDVEAAGEPLRLYPTLDTTDLTPIPVPAPEPAPPPVAIEDQPDVVGTYKSGGNTYVMFSNGSIEAETPRGRFTFASLDELKDFVRAGGENDTRGAA